jgi:hypothetical protein
MHFDRSVQCHNVFHRFLFIAMQAVAVCKKVPTGTKASDFILRAHLAPTAGDPAISDHAASKPRESSNLLLQALQPTTPAPDQGEYAHDPSQSQFIKDSNRASCLLFLRRGIMHTREWLKHYPFMNNYVNQGLHYLYRMHAKFDFYARLISRYAITD